jgi:CRISPR-associated protein Csm3
VTEYKIIICLKSDLHISSGFGFARIVDLINVKDANGFAYVPASTIKGKLRSACSKVALILNDEPSFMSKEHKLCNKLEADVCKHENPKDRCIICRLFGSSFIEGKLVFKDAVINEDDANKIRVLSSINLFRVDEQNEVRNSVKLSRSLRISSPQNLFTVETTSRKLTFNGSIYAKEYLTEQEQNLLKFGLKIISHIGGQKARGLGRIESICCPELGLKCRRLIRDE